jgi:hypothetical protein
MAAGKPQVHGGEAVSKTKSTIKERADIPSVFRRGKSPVASNVGELVDILKQLPRDLPLSFNCDDYVEVSAPSVNGASFFVCSLNGVDEDEYEVAKS